MALSGIPVSELSGSAATDALHATIKEYNEKTSLQTEKMISLTVTMKWLTIVMTIGLFIQIGLAFAGKC